MLGRSEGGRGGGEGRDASWAAWKEVLLGGGPMHWMYCAVLQQRKRLPLLGSITDVSRPAPCISRGYLTKPWVVLFPGPAVDLYGSDWSARGGR